MSTYEAIIGLEIHAQISTKTKMFCRCDNDSFEAEPNINTCEICMGFPGTLPVINEKAVEKAIKAALALNGKIPKFSRFDRKNYFYPDLPKGYQISQYDQPLSVDGYLEIETDNITKEPLKNVVSSRNCSSKHVFQRFLKRIGITRLHMEDDAGKLIHVINGSLCDYNRAGTPLMEIVSEPDLRSEQEAVAYAKEIQKILRYTDSSDCDMEKGMMRFDINVSVRKKGTKEFGTKVEIKNVNSFRALRKSIAYEIKRQTELLKKGEKIIQETRGFNDEKGITEGQRIKEEAQDYRYFPEPDLPPLIQDEKKIEEMKKSIPELPLAKKKRYQMEYNLSDEDAGILTEEFDRAVFFEETVTMCSDPKKTASYMNGILLQHLNEEGKTLGGSKITPELLCKLIKLINEGKISNNLAKGEIFEEMYRSGKNPEKIIAEKGIFEVSDEGKLRKIAEKVINENPQIVEQYRKGKESVIGFFIGQIMKETRGKANSRILHTLLKKLLRA